MGRPSLRETLIESGVRTLHERGLAATGVREIVAAAGVPQGSFTNHFASKEAFALAVLERYCERTYTIMDATLRDETRRPVERLHAYFDAIGERLGAAGFRHGCLIGNLSLEAAEHSEPIRERLIEVFSRLTEPFADAVRDAQRAGELRDDLPSDEVATALLGAWYGAMMRMKVERNPAALDTFRRVLFVLLAPPHTRAREAAKSSTKSHKPKR